MKAVYIESHGGPEALIYGERPDPAIQPNFVTVRVKAASLNRLDVYTRAGVRGMRKEFPRLWCWEETPQGKWRKSAQV